MRERLASDEIGTTNAKSQQYHVTIYVTEIATFVGGLQGANIANV
jgi:hypothetical protein